MRTAAPGANEQFIGLRYVLPVPKGAKIAKAYVEFTCDETKGGTQPVNLIIQGQLIANAPAFLSTANDISNRTTRTKAQVKWAVENWTTVAAKSKTPDLSPILQELVNQTGWASGNAIVLIFSDDKSKPSTGDSLRRRLGRSGPAPPAPCACCTSSSLPKRQTWTRRRVKRDPAICWNPLPASRRRRERFPSRLCGGNLVKIEKLYRVACV